MGDETEREVWKEPVGVVGVIVPVELPGRDHPQQARARCWPWATPACSSRRPTRRGTPPASAGSIAEQTDIPPGVVNVVASSDHLVGEVLTTSPLVDMVAFTGSTATGRRIMQAAVGQPEAGVPRARRQVGQPGARRRRLRGHDPGLRRRCASTPARAAPCRPGCSCPRSRYDEAVELAAAGLRRREPTATPPTRQPHGPARLRSASASGCSATSRRARPRGPAWSAAAAGPPTCPRAGTSSPRCSPTSTTRMTIAQEEIFGPVLVDDPLRGRRRRRAHRQRQPLRPVGDDHLRRPRPGQGRRPPDPHRHPRPQRRRLVRRRRARSAATSSRASAASAASRAWRSSPRPRRSAGRPDA